MKQNHIAIIFGVLAIGGAFGLGWNYRLQPESSPSATNTATATLLNAQNNPQQDVTVTKHRFEEMQKELDQMRDKLGLLEEQQRSAQANTSNFEASATVTENNDPADIEAQKLKEVQQVEAKQKLFMDAFQGEPMDPKWSEKTQTNIREVYSAATDKGVIVEDAECRSTLCRVKFSVDQPELKGHKQLMDLMEKTPWSGYRHVHFDPTTREAIMYMSREGTTLPDGQSNSADEETTN